MPNLKVPETLKGDCTKCQGLCCMAPQHERKEGFPILKDKPIGEACPNLEIKCRQSLYKCQIYDTVEREGWTTCKAYDCNGAGQTISQFFRELGYTWAAPHPNLDVSTAQILRHNLIYSYNILETVFSYLQFYNKPEAEFIYRKLLKSIQPVLVEFGNAIEDKTIKIDPDFWIDKFVQAFTQGLILTN